MGSFGKSLKKAIKGYFINRAIKRLERKYPRVQVEYNWIANKYKVTYTIEGGLVYMTSGSRKEVTKYIKDRVAEDLLEGI